MVAPVVPVTLTLAPASDQPLTQVTPVALHHVAPIGALVIVIAVVIDHHAIDIDTPAQFAFLEVLRPAAVAQDVALGPIVPFALVAAVAPQLAAGNDVAFVFFNDHFLSDAIAQDVALGPELAAERTLAVTGELIARHQLAHALQPVAQLIVIEPIGGATVIEIGPRLVFCFRR